MKRTHSAFTLVELLVVITIITILMGLLIPAVNAARESARRAQCNTQLKNFGLAAIQHENTKGSLPGYVNRFGVFIGDGMGGPGDDPSEPGTQMIDPHVKIGTWAVSILPWLDAQPTYEHWTQDRYPLIDLATLDGDYLATDNDQFEGVGFHQLACPNLAVFQCPSNPITDANNGRNSYISNNGFSLFITSADVDAEMNPTNPTPPGGLVTPPTVTKAVWRDSMKRSQGAFNVQYESLPYGTDPSLPNTGDSVRLDDFKDGQGMTVLFSENVQALPWHRAGYINPTTHMTAGIDFSVTPPVVDIVYAHTSLAHEVFAAKYTNGMVWHYEDDAYTTLPAHPIVGPCSPVYKLHRINGGGSGPGQDIFTLQMSNSGGTAYNYVDLARPSSAHVGGVNAATADGGTRFLNETIDYRVYQALLTLRGKSSDVPFSEYILSDESL